MHLKLVKAAFFEVQVTEIVCNFFHVCCVFHAACIHFIFIHFSTFFSLFSAFLSFFSPLRCRHKKLMQSINRCRQVKVLERREITRHEMLRKIMITQNELRAMRKVKLSHEESQTWYSIGNVSRKLEYMENVWAKKKLKFQEIKCTEET